MCILDTQLPLLLTFQFVESEVSGQEQISGVDNTWIRILCEFVVSGANETSVQF